MRDSLRIALVCWMAFVGFGKRGVLEKGSFQKSPFSRDSREFRDSRVLENRQTLENQGAPSIF